MSPKAKNILSLQLLNILFSLSSVVVKIASLQMQRAGLFSWQTILAMAVYVLLLGVYAIFWQKILKRVSLSTAYLHKGLSIFWILLWSVLLLNESITVWNLVGTAVVCAGTILVGADE